MRLTRVDMQQEYIGAYPTWDIRGFKSLRPTNEFCLMRNMTSRSFCSGTPFLLLVKEADDHSVQGGNVGSIPAESELG